MLKRIRVALLAGSLFIFGAMSAQAAIVNGVFQITGASFTDLFSTTLDNNNNPVLPNPTCTGLSGNALQECQFFGGEVPASPRAIIVSDNGYNAGQQFGTLDVQYDDATGEITQINNLQIFLQDLTVSIFGGSTVVQIINGNGMGVTGCITGTCTPTAVADDQAKILAGLNTGVANTADADQAPAIGQVSIFQHADAIFFDAPNFSTFEDVTDSCTGSLCNLVGGLTLDADRYRIDGDLNGTSFTLRSQTSNNSVYTVNFSIVPVPAAVWLFGSALGLLGWMRRRAT